ncbi:MAG: hypothetical protein ACKOAU_07425 [Pirellula sp.]
MLFFKWLNLSGIFLSLLFVSASTTRSAVISVDARGNFNGPFYTLGATGVLDITLPVGTTGPSSLLVLSLDPASNILATNDLLQFHGAHVVASTYGERYNVSRPGLITGDNGFVFDSREEGIDTHSSPYSTLPLVVAFFGELRYNGFDATPAAVGFFYDWTGSRLGGNNFVITTFPDPVPEPTSAAIALVFAGSGLFYRRIRRRS